MKSLSDTIAMVVVYLIVLTTVLAFTWNYLIAPAFGINEITFFQAFGLLVVSNILFKPSRIKAEISENN